MTELSSEFILLDISYAAVSLKLYIVHPEGSKAPRANDPQEHVSRSEKC